MALFQFDSLGFLVSLQTLTKNDNYKDNYNYISVHTSAQFDVRCFKCPCPDSEKIILKENLCAVIIAVMLWTILLYELFLELYLYHYPWHEWAFRLFYGVVQLRLQCKCSFCINDAGSNLA